MDKLILPLSTSTDSMRTSTSCPTESSSSTDSTKPSRIWVIWTRPSALFPSAVTVTKAPKGARRATLPLTQVSGAMLSKGVRSTGSRKPPPPPPPKPSRMDKLILLESKSTDSIRTLTSWPTETSSSTLSTKPSLILDTCTKPSAAVPSSRVTVTKAPKGAVRATTPLNHSSEGKSAKGVRSAGGRRPPSVNPSTMVKPYFPSSSLLPEIHTSTCCPSDKTS
mmetsp:Transcript_36015/g.58994  ORF Transcript_36015/g.58994 Transcript_36015/m.58994 type:complete len:222 (+) Transcript_36015:212-877(+)